MLNSRHVYPLLIVLALLITACASSQPSVNLTASSPPLDETQTMDTPLPSPTAPSVTPTPGTWLTYTNSEYGFSFSYPPHWTIEKRDALPNFLWLHRQQRPTLKMDIAFKRITEEKMIQRTGVGAGDVVRQGTVLFFDREVPRDVLIYEGKVKAVHYNNAQEIRVDGLAFTLSCINGDPDVDYELIDLGVDIQEEVDDIVQSFEYIP
jgi:hypothetical protein